MKEDLLPYYNHELNYLREMGAEFARNYPQTAGKLLLEPTKCEDPHVERLLEGFAFLTARIHHKLDEEFPEITASLLEVLYPHYIRPVPSMSIAQFSRSADEGQSTAGEHIPRETVLVTRTMGSSFCTFRTCYPVTLWPVSVKAAMAGLPVGIQTREPVGEAAAAIRITLQCAEGLTFAALNVPSVRFYINGPGDVAHTLYELIFNNPDRVIVRDLSRHDNEVVLPADSIGEVGFDPQEGMIPYPDRSFLGYRLLQEYFSLREKFLFFDVQLRDACRARRFGNSIEVIILLKSFEHRERLQLLKQHVTADTFLLGCTPIINLFKRSAEPIRVSHTEVEYPVVPDIYRLMSTEVYSIDSVRSVTPGSTEVTDYQPFYSLRHGHDGPDAYWFATRKPSRRKGYKGTDVSLTLVNSAFEPATSRPEVLTVDVTCTNRDVAGQWPATFEFGELKMEGRAGVRVRFVLKPTAPQHPPLRRASQWRLISHLTLNYLSIVDGGRDALQEILRLYNFTESPVNRAHIDGIRDIASTPQAARVLSQYGVVFCPGTGVRIEFDEDQYVGASAYLIAAVLERFLSLYAAVNSFTQLTAVTMQRRGELRIWPPRAGDKILL